MAVVDDYLWIVIASGIVCILMAWGIGAIDIATSVASGIGAKAFTLKQAVFIILIFEFSGAALMGGKVTETVRTKITDYESFAGEEHILMLGMFTSLVAATIWLYYATKFEVPISSAHSIVGGIIGFVMVAKGPGAVVWSLLGWIAMFWIFSPMLTACISIAFFVPMRAYLLRREDAWEHTLRVWPIFAVIVVWIGAQFFFMEEYGIGHATWMSMTVGITLSTLLYFAVIRTGWLENYCIKAVAKDERRKLEIEAAKKEKAMMASPTASERAMMDHLAVKINGTTTEEEHESGNERVSPRAADNDIEVRMVDMDSTEFSEVHRQTGAQSGEKKGVPPPSVKKQYTFKPSMSGLEVDVHQDLDDLEAQIHAKAEKFDPRVEKAFSLLQLASASLDNFAHGSNDVANAVAPFASIWYLYHDKELQTDITVPFWMIAILIAGMIVGLSTYGHRVVKSLGVKLSCLTNTRGYGTELSSAVVVIFGSYFGFPASSAHVQVGAIVGTGIAEKVGNSQCDLKWSALINWQLLAEMFASWFLTVVVCGGISAGLFAMMSYSPYLGGCPSS